MILSLIHIKVLTILRAFLFVQNYRLHMNNEEFYWECGDEDLNFFIYLFLGTQSKFIRKLVYIDNKRSKSRDNLES